jgi:ABC-type branched-subunit amino acid transport system ATPase component
MTEPLLAVRGVKTFYGSICALKGVDLDVHDGEIITLIGANGAGKSTLMMTIFGNPRAREGRISFAGRDITDLPTHEVARSRIAQAPEGRPALRPTAARSSSMCSTCFPVLPSACRNAAARCRAASSRCLRSPAR